MYKLFLKHFKFDGIKNEVLLSKLKEISTVDEGLAIMVKHGWFISADAVKAIKAEAENFTEKDVKKIDEKLKDDAEKELEAKENEADTKKSVEDAQGKAVKKGE